MTPNPISHSELVAAVARMQLGTTASDLHGAVTGYLCGGGAAAGCGVLEALALESGDAHAGDRAHALFDRLCNECRRQLRGADAGFTPLLPARDEPLPVRADALVDWCCGFLGGLGMAGMVGARGISPVAREILDDFGHIAAMQVSCADEDDERSLAEVIDFVREGVLLLRTELSSGEPGASA
jgi:uncharacterized protein